MTASAALVPVQVVPPKWRVLILGAGFGDVGAFKKAADNFTAEVRTEATLGGYYNKEIAFEVAPWANRLPTAIRDDGKGSCTYDRDEALGDALTKAFSTWAPRMTSILVINNGKKAEACAAGDLMIADKNATAAVAHEMGHAIGGLFDEKDGGATRAAVAGPNCISDLTRVPWSGLMLNAAPKPGCWNDGRLYKPSAMCRMFSNGANFCDVCADRIDQVMKKTIPTVSNLPDHTQFVLQIWKHRTDAKQISRQVFNTRQPAQLIRGPVVTGAVVGATTCLGGTYLDRQSTRKHAGNDESTKEIFPDDTDSLFAVVNCPGVLEDGALQRLQLREIRLTPTLWLTPSIFMAPSTEILRTFNVVR